MGYKLYFDENSRLQMSLEEGDDDFNALVLSIFIPLLRYWHQPKGGSRLFTLKKMLSDTPAMAETYCKEASTWLVPKRFKSLEFKAKKTGIDRMYLSITGTKANGQPVAYEMFFRVN